MRLDSSGNLGLGVTPSAWSAGTKAFELANGGVVSFAGYIGTVGAVNAYYNSGWKYTTSNFAARYDQNAGTHVWFNAPSGTAGNAITFTQAMTLDASGNLLVGTTSNDPSGRGAASKLVSAGVQDSMTLYQTNNTYFNLVSAFNTTTGTRYHVSFKDGSTPTERGYISTNGALTVYSTTSDYRLKEDIKPMISALAKVMQLKPCTYTWKESKDKGEGFIAHELQSVVPDCVIGEKDAVNENGSIKPQAIDTSFLVATLTAAIQEQQALIESLTTRLTALEAK
jgi:hypothetical protein